MATRVEEDDRQPDLDGKLTVWQADGPISGAGSGGGRRG